MTRSSVSGRATCCGSQSRAPQIGTLRKISHATAPPERALPNPTSEFGFMALGMDGKVSAIGARHKHGDSHRALSPRASRHVRAAEVLEPRRKKPSAAPRRVVGTGQ